MPSLKNRLLAIALLAVLAISSACRASGTQRQLADTLAASPSMHTPPADTGTGVEISAHSIGPIPVDSSLGAVAKLLPAYRVGTAYLEEIPIVTWSFQLRGAMATATQASDSIDPSLPAETWFVSGSRILLPGHVPLPSTWGELRRAFPGPAMLSLGELGARAEICQLPGLSFQLLLNYGAADIDTMTAESIPRQTGVVQVQISRRAVSSCS